MIGLDQSRFPGAMLQDPVLLDVERSRLAKGMILSGEILHENTYLFAKVLSSLKGRVTLSYPCRDLRDDRELFPSLMLLNVYRLISGDRKGDYSALARYLGEPAGFIPHEKAIPLNEWEWWLKKRNVETESVLSAYLRI